jgi:Cys-tRNA(Pro)/Cys-tRNA(Cys) deacylase
MEKTMAMRVLEGRKIAYTVLTYPDELRDAVEIANALNLKPSMVFKTLVVLPPETGKKPILVMIPADQQLDLKSLALATGAKKLKMATHREAESITGLEVGGISALVLLNKGFQVLIDESARNLAEVCISAGKRGLQIKVNVKDLVTVTNARMEPASIR